MYLIKVFINEKDNWFFFCFAYLEQQGYQLTRTPLRTELVGTAGHPFFISQ